MHLRVNFECHLIILFLVNENMVTLLSKYLSNLMGLLCQNWYYIILFTVTILLLLQADIY